MSFDALTDKIIRQIILVEKSLITTKTSLLIIFKM